MNPIEYIDRLILEIVTLKGPTLLMAFLIVLGYGMKFCKWFDNIYIPVVVVTLATLLAPLMLFWPQFGKQEGELLRWPDATAWVQTFLAGFLIGCLSWLLHNKILKPYIDDKLNGGKPKAP